MKKFQRKNTLMPILAFAIIVATISCSKIKDEEVLPQAQLKTTTGKLALKAGVMSINDFGAVGDGKTDNYAAFVAAAAYASSHANTTINFPAGTYYIAKYRTIKNDKIDHIWWKNCTGLKLIGEKGTIISMNGNFFRPLAYTLSDGSKKSYASGLSFWFYHCKNVEIRNFEMTGNVQKTRRAPGVDENNPSVTESQNIMLRFTMSDNVIIDNIYAHHAECDGLKIGGDRINGEWINSTNFTVTNVKSYNNGRLGMSIGGLDNGYFKNCEFNNNGFTGGNYGQNDPAGGVDIEPGEYHDNDNIKFEACSFINNYGVHFACTAPVNTTRITLLKCTVTTGTETSKTQGITILAKNVLIDGCNIKLGTRTMKFTNPKKPGATTVFKNSTIEGSDNVITSTSMDARDSFIFSNNQFTYTKDVLTKNFITLQTKNLQFLNNKVFISSAAIKSRPKGTHVLVENAIISSGNKFYSEQTTIKPTVSYKGTKTVADL